MASNRALLLLPVVVASAAACDTSVLPAPRITSIEADSLRKIIGDDADRAFDIVGENFTHGVTPDAGNPDDSKRDALRISILRQGETLPIFVLGTVIDPTLIRTELPASIDEDLDRGLFDVTVYNPDGTSDTMTSAFELGYPAVSVVFDGNGQSDAPGDANSISSEIRLAAADGLQGWVKAPFTPTLVLLQGTNATATLSGTFAALDDTTVTLLVTDSAAEPVRVTLTDLPAGLSVSEATLTFLAGSGVRVRVVPGAEVNISDDFFDTVIQVEDAWGNPTGNHPDYGVDFSVAICTGATVDPDTFPIPGGTAMLDIKVFCDATNDAFVTISETTATSLEEVNPAVIEFN